MKSYVKNGLEYTYLVDEAGKDAILFVTADSIYEKLGYVPENKSRWITDNLIKKYSDKSYFNDFDHGYCIDVQIAEDLLSTIKTKSRQKAKAIADMIAIEEDDFYMNDKWKESSVKDQDSFYKKHLQPKVTSALDNITKTAETPFFNPKVFLPDELTINGKKYVCKERYEQDMVSLQFKMDALKSILEK